MNNKTTTRPTRASAIGQGNGRFPSEYKQEGNGYGYEDQVGNLRDLFTFEMFIPRLTSQKRCISNTAAIRKWDSQRTFFSHRYH